MSHAIGVLSPMRNDLARIVVPPPDEIEAMLSQNVERFPGMTAASFVINVGFGLGLALGAAALLLL
jgi:hypothetical protein